MEIYLMQHGPALPKDQDPEEGLSPEGKDRIHASGRALKKLGVTFDAVLCSPKRRSRETAAIVAEQVGFSLEKILETIKVKAMTPPEETVQELSELGAVNRVLIAGHLPSVAQVASFLLTGDGVDIQFEMGGCCRIDVDELPTHSGRLMWYLPPAVLGLISSEQQ
jgi:phosphohistidine phosphatase